MSDVQKDGAVATRDLGMYQVDRHILKLLAEPIHEILEELSEEIQRNGNGGEPGQSTPVERNDSVETPF